MIKEIKEWLQNNPRTKEEKVELELAKMGIDIYHVLSLVWDKTTRKYTNEFIIYKVQEIMEMFVNNLPESMPVEIVEERLVESMDIVEKSNNTEKAESVIPQSAMIPIGQIDKTYIIAKDDEGMYIVDQHAAHERILFDRYSARADNIPSQQLLIHQYLDFDSRESQLVEKNIELFASLGFYMEPSGKNQFRLMEVPADIEMSEAEYLLQLPCPR